MPAPPMKQDIVLRVEQLDENGQVITNRNGVAIRVPVESKARVKYSGEQIFTANGDEAEAVLELRTPPELEIRTGDIVEWVDEFGVTIRGPVAKIEEARNYGGTKVYYRKAWTT